MLDHLGPGRVRNGSAGEALVGSRKDRLVRLGQMLGVPPVAHSENILGRDPRRGCHPPVLRPFVSRARDPADPHDHQFAQPRIEFVVLQQLHQLMVRHPGDTGIIGQHAKRLALGTPCRHTHRISQFAGALQRHHRHA